jgi:hypothetical protein
MANDFTKNIVFIDDFSANIDLSVYYDPHIELWSIEWTGGTSTDHYCQVREGGATGPIIFHKQCTTAKGSFMSEFFGLRREPLYIAKTSTNLNASGNLIIIANGPRIR